MQPRRIRQTRCDADEWSMDFKYRAFLSYCHADTPLAKDLHTRLESFPLRGLTGRETALGLVPKSLRPIFRDRLDFSPGLTFNEQTIGTLEASAALVVLCSPASAKSAAVNEEVRLFKHRWPHRPLVPVILAGRTKGGDEECFPPALKFELDAEGQVTDHPAPMTAAADVRPAGVGDGRELALAKVVAALIGVPPDQVFQRAERERRRQARIRNAIAAAMLVLFSAGGYFGWRSYTQQQTLTDIDALVNQYAPIGSAEAAQPGARERLRSAFESIAKGTAADPHYKQALDLIKAGKPKEAEPLLRAAAEDEEAAGLQRLKQAAEKWRNLGAIAGYADPKRAREYYAKAAKLDPDNIAGMELLGSMEMEAGNLSEAERAFRHVLSTGQKGRDDEDLYNARLGMGDILVQRGDLAEALENYHEASAEADRLAKTKPGNAFWQRNLSSSYERVGAVLMARGNVQDALKSFRDSLAIAEGLASAHPNDAGLQRDLSMSYVHVGDLLVAQGDLQSALKSFRDGLAIANHLAKAEPSSAAWQRDLSALHERVGDVLAEEGNLVDAFENYRDGLGIAERLAKSDPGNASWQRDLWVAYEKAGDVLRAQGNLPEALTRYGDGLGIAERLAKMEPSNVRWRQDLMASYLSLGDVLFAQGNLQGALNSSRDGQAIAELLAKQDPGNAAWQRELSVAREKVGNVLRKQGNLPEALKSYRDSLAIRDRLANQDPENAGWQRDLSVSYSKIGNLLVLQGSFPEALESYHVELAILDRLAKANPSNLAFQSDLATTHVNLGQLYVRIGDKTEARRIFERGRAIVAPLAEKTRQELWIGYLRRFDGDISTLEKQDANEAIEGTFEAGDFAKAAAMQAELAAAIEKAETEKEGKAGPLTAQEQGNLAWYRLFTREFDKALAASERGLALRSGGLGIATNRAHALMFLGRAEEARTAYLEHKGKEIAGQGEWGVVVLKDFAEFEKRGLAHPQMAAIRALLASAAQTR